MFLGIQWTYLVPPFCITPVEFHNVFGITKLESLAYHDAFIV